MQRTRPWAPPTHDAGQEAALPRYWLGDTSLFDSPGGHEIWKVTAPVLVELFPDGRVRPASADSEAFIGYLPQGYWREARADRGLMLYAQKMLDVHIGRPDGPIMGRLHPGARVALQPYEAYEKPAARIELPLGTAISGERAFYVDRAGLSAEPKVADPRLPHGRGRSMRVYGLLACGEGSLRFSFEDMYCEDIWFPADGGKPSQYVRGIEVICDFSLQLWPPSGWYGPRDNFSLHCPRRQVSRDGDALLLTGPDEPPRVVEEVPKQFAPVTHTEPDPLEHRIARGGPVYWLILTQSGPVCEEWQFHPTPSVRGSHPGPQPAVARLARVRAIKDDKDDWLSNEYPVTYEPASKHRLPTLRWGERRFWTRQRDYNYELLAVSGDELRMTAQRGNGDDVVAYDPGDAERWFLSRSACDAARDEVAEALERDPGIATQVGFHVREP